MARNKKKNTPEDTESVAVPLPRLAIEGELTIYVAAEMKPRLAALLDEIAQSSQRLGEIDLSQVSEIDSAGLQLLLLAKREAATRGAALALCGHSQAVIDCLDMCDLGATFGDPIVIAA
jgi:anti-anti-sigma factor